MHACTYIYIRMCMCVFVCVCVCVCVHHTHKHSRTCRSCRKEGSCEGDAKDMLSTPPPPPLKKIGEVNARHPFCAPCPRTMSSTLADRVAAYNIQFVCVCVCARAYIHTIYIRTQTQTQTQTQTHIIYRSLSIGSSGGSSFEFGGNRVNNDGSVVLRTASFRLTAILKNQ